MHEKIARARESVGRVEADNDLTKVEPGSVKAKNYSWSAAKFKFEFHAKNFKIHKKRKYC
jgi:hypothetical protein